MEKRWDFAPKEPALESRIARALNISPITAQLLVARGVRELAEARTFLRPSLDALHDPLTLDNMPAAIERLEKAVRDKEKIGIYGDYDVDGTTGTAIIQKFFALLDADVTVRIPHRVTDGYGLNLAAIEDFASRGVKVLITIDCGTSNLVEISRAVEHGIDVIVLDHHEPPAVLPPAYALVNAKLAGSRYPFRGLCSAGLCFKLAWAFANGRAAMKSRPEFHAFLLDAMGYVALGTVADVSPLVGENRILVRYGLDALTGCTSPGLRALIEKAHLEEKAIDTEAIAFRLAPRINAIGRLGNASDAVELLTSTDPVRISALLELIESSNRSRRDIEHQIFDDAKVRVGNEAVIVVSDPKWHVGVVGIVAARLVDAFARPAFVLAEDGDITKGSGRSIDGFALHEALAACRDLTISGGGHARAAGVSLKIENLDAFRARLNSVASTLPPAVSKMRVDDEIPLASLTKSVVREIGLLAPHGEANPPATFVASHCRLAGEPRLMGKKNAHMSFHVAQNGGPALRAVAFDGAEHYDGIVKSSTLSVAFTPQINAWKGREEVELVVQDVKLL